MLRTLTYTLKLSIDMGLKVPNLSSQNTVLFIGRNWPNPRMTAAGWRMMQLVNHFDNENFGIHFATTDSLNNTKVFEKMPRVKTWQIALNDDGFDAQIKTIAPDYVVFDRFMTEEQYGWRVRDCCPEAITILDTEDCHFLRLTRAQYIKERPDIFDASDCPEESLFNQHSMRELASIWRCDLSLIIAQYEYELLRDVFSIPEGLLCYLPLAMAFDPTESNQADAPRDLAWSERKDFLWVGNRKHEPNDDSLKYLLQVLWPSIQGALPKAALHIVGPNGTESQRQLIVKHKSVVDLGWVDELPELMSQYRINLAPLRFGAGLKGKIMQSLGLGLPTVSSTIGAEGLFTNTIPELEPAQNADEFINKAIKLYTDEQYWQQAKIQGIECMKQHFSLGPSIARFNKDLLAIKNDLKAHRKRHFMGQILQHQSLNASKYMGRWLTLKNAQTNPK